MVKSVPATVSSGSVVRFGVFEADLRSGELHKCGVKIKIQELPFQALKLLVSRPNEVVSRDDLRHVLWPDGVYVEFDRGVISTINRLRESLGDSAENPVFIETVGRRGYRWIAPTHISEPRHEAPVDDEEARFAPQEAANVHPLEPTKAHHALALPLALRRRKYLFLAAALLLSAGATFWAARVLPNRSHRANVLMASPAAGSGSSRAPANREAEEFYLKGRYYWEKRTPESLNKAVDSFMQAIVHDPGYAPAYVGLADCYNLLREYTVMPAYEAYPRALAAARKAVELDPQSSEAHASLAFVSFYGMWDAATADREFRRALELNPNSTAAHHWYATFLSCLRRYPESLAEIERAQALDPASKSVLADKGSLLFNAGRRNEAIALLKQMEENEPDFISPHRYLKFIYLITADYPHYLAEARREAVLMHDSSALAIADAIERAFAARGGKGLLEALSAEQKKLYDRGQLSPFFLATTYSIMDNKQEALRYLKIAYERRVDGVAQIESDHAFDNLSREAAFQKIVTEVGLPPVS